MRNLTIQESQRISGGTQACECAGDASDFWYAATLGAGVGVGVIGSIPITIGLTVYSVLYYGVYTPVHYIASGIHAVGTTAFSVVLGDHDRLSSSNPTLPI